MPKIAINGFGRIGRAVAKIVSNRPDFELVAINDLGDSATLSHLLKYDSCYGIYDKEVGYSEKEIIIDNKRIHFFSEKDPTNLPWGELQVDAVIECTGIFLTEEAAKPHLDGGSKKVILSAPPKDDSVATYVMGVNADQYKGEAIVSNASCTTNCITPVMKVLTEKLGIEKSLMTTIHSYTADQNLVDGPHKDLRRARGAAINIVPTSTGAAKAAFKTIPSLEGKFDGLAIRVPTPVVSLADMTVLVSRDTSVEEINSFFVEAEKNELKGILATTDQPIVSSDLIGMENSSMVDLSLTQVVGGNFIKVIAWYDNEWGYSNRLVDLAAKVCG